MIGQAPQIFLLIVFDSFLIANFNQSKKKILMIDDLKISSLLAQRKKVPFKNQSTTKAENLVMSIFDLNKIQKT